MTPRDRKTRKTDKDEIRDEYPEELIKSGVREKHTRRIREGTNIVQLQAC